MGFLLATITEEHTSQLEFAGLPVSWGRLLMLLLVVGVCALVVWMYHREARAGASRRLRIWLAAIRCTVLLLLAVVWLEPVLAEYLRRTIAARVIVLIDSSTSMSIRDGAGIEAEHARRADRMAELLTRDNSAWLKRLADKNELYVYSYGDRVSPLDLPFAKKPAPPAQTQTATATQPGADAGDLTRLRTANEDRTDLGQAVARALTDAGDAPIAGIIALTDGVVNRGMSIDNVAGTARRARAGIYAVAVGDSVEPPNLRVSDLSAPATAAKGDPIEVKVRVAANGIVAPGTPVELTAQPLHADTAGEPVVLGRSTANLGADGEIADLTFRVTPDTAGEFVYRARVAALPEEAVEFDNVRATSVQVLDQHLRVLLVAGRPSYDYRAVTRLFELDQTIDLSCWLQSADREALRDGDVQITELPRKPEEIFAYDAIILMDPDPREFDSSLSVTLRRFVDEFGGGLLMAAGPQFSARFLNDERLEELLTILPVVPDPDAAVRLTQRGPFTARSSAMVIPEDANSNPLVEFSSSPDANRAIWQALPGVWWHLPLLRTKQLAVAAIRAATVGGKDDQPILLATQPLGAGRVVFLAFDGTWRWRATAEAEFNRFWIQMVRYLAQPRRQGASKRGAIVLDRDAPGVGESVKVDARMLDANFVPWHQPSIDLQIKPGEGEPRTVTLQATTDREGWFTGRVAFDEGGPTTLKIPLPDADPAAKAEDAALVKHVQVQRSDVELRRLRVDGEALAKLAQQTRGRVLNIREAETLPAEIPAASVTTPLAGLRTPLWDRGWLMILIAGLLGVEWTLRRRNHLL